MPEKAGRFPLRKRLAGQVSELLYTFKMGVRNCAKNKEHQTSMPTEAGVTVTKMQKQLISLLTDQEMVVYT